MAKRRRSKGKRKKGGKRRRKSGGVSAHGRINYVPCRDNKGVFRHSPNCKPHK